MDNTTAFVVGIIVLIVIYLIFFMKNSQEKFVDSYTALKAKTNPAPVQADWDAVKAKYDAAELDIKNNALTPSAEYTAAKTKYLADLAPKA